MDTTTATATAAHTPDDLMARLWVRIWHGPAEAELLARLDPNLRGRWMNRAAVPRHPAQRTPCLRFTHPDAFI